MQGFFPRETGPEARGTPLNLERALQVTPDADKFLRIVMEAWLERNGVLDPLRKAQAEPSVLENQLHPSMGAYQPPTTDALHGLLLLVAHLVARKVDADVAAAAAAQGRGARLHQYGQQGAVVVMVPPLCPALRALQQPLFVFLCLTFRHMRVAPQCWTQFLLGGELWLAWIDPGRTWRQAFPEPGGQGAQQQQQQQQQQQSGGRGVTGARWREQHLKMHVAANLHFYTTLFVLYMRKAREALGSDASRQFQVLSQALRVMAVFRDTALHDALQSASRHAAELWQQAGGGAPVPRGGVREALLRHLVVLRLQRSRPCLVADAEQDAHHLAAELLAAQHRVEKEQKDEEGSWGHARKAGRWVWAALCSVFADEGSYDEPPSGGQVKAAELVALMKAVLVELYGIFPNLEAKCTKPLGDTDAAASRDADRQGLLLTARGRTQLLQGVRGCDPTKARFLGDPLFNPELGEHELAALVRGAQWLSVALCKQFYPSWEPPADANAAAASATVKKGGQPPPPPHEGGHVDVGRQTAEAAAPINLRWLADKRNYHLPCLLLCVYLVLALFQRMLQGVQKALSE